MVKNVKRIFVEKKKAFDVEGQNLFLDLKENLGVENLKSVRVINRYDVKDCQMMSLKHQKDSIF